MDRRRFLSQSTAASALLLSGISIEAKPITQFNRPFQLNYAPHFGMFENSAGSDLIDQIQFMFDQGFRALEDNDMKTRDKETQNSISAKLNELGMTMGVFVGHTIYWDQPNLASGDQNMRVKFLSEIEESIEVAKRVKAKWITVVPGTVDQSLEMGYQTSNVIEVLRAAASLLEPHNIIMVLEPLNFRDHPGMFLTGSSQAYEICKAVDSPSCKILFDIYHQQISEGNLISNIDKCFDEIAYLQVADNPGRKEPTTGEINFNNVFEFINDKGYKGVIGMEHGNSVPGLEGEILMIDAYHLVDPL